MEVLNDFLLETYLNKLKEKRILTKLQRDIILSLKKYNEEPFDRIGAEKRIEENKKEYPELNGIILSLPQVELKQFQNSSAQDIKGGLELQIRVMCAKDMSELLNKKIHII